MNLNGIVLEKSLCLLCTGSLAIFWIIRQHCHPFFYSATGWTVPQPAAVFLRQYAKLNLTRLLRTYNCSEGKECLRAWVPCGS